MPYDRLAERHTETVSLGCKSKHSSGVKGFTKDGEYAPGSAGKSSGAMRPPAAPPAAAQRPPDMSPPELGPPGTDGKSSALKPCL